MPTDLARGPWDPDACHAGPPTGLLVRALETALPELRLARISVDLGRPVPMAGFTVHAEVVRAGRATGNTRVAIVDGDGNVRVTATGMHVAVATVPLFEQRLDNSGVRVPRLADAVPVSSRSDRSVTGCLASATPSRSATRRRGRPPRADHGVDAHACRCCPTRSRRRSSGSARSPTAATPSAATPSRLRCSSSTPTWSSPCTATRSASGSAAGSSRRGSRRASASPTPCLFDDEGPVGRALQTLLLRPAP